MIKVTNGQLFGQEHTFSQVGNDMLSSEQHRLLYRIATQYYVDGMTQQQIADRAGLSRPKVSRILQQGRDLGVINITLVPPLDGMADIERQLEHKYGLIEAVVVPVSDPESHPTVVRELGPAAAEYLSRCISGDEVIATAWGTSILALSDALSNKSWPGVTVVQMLGGLGPSNTPEHSSELIQHLGSKLGAKVRMLPAPGVVPNREMADFLRADPQIAAVLQLAAQADVAVVGLGVPNPHSMVVRSGLILSKEDLDHLQSLGAVGDIALRYLDKTGNSIDLEINERIIGLALDQIRNISLVIGIAGGINKHEIVRAALLGEILNVLVTDLSTAEALLAEDK
ncbi:MAG TPA: sugar-binding transcriptional regulator [candidate division Zixibacteria bacterium]|nr:sugar-binding transcriptional regulator [candidate division Zixibacteria bacterium]